MNVTLATPIKDAKAGIIVEYFQENITYLSKQDFKPVFDVIDNVSPNAIKSYLDIENIKL